MNLNAVLIENNPDGYIWIDTGGKIRYANPAFQKETGYLTEEIIDKPLNILYHNADDEVKVEYDLSMARRKGTVTVEGWKLRKDGSRFWAEQRLTAVLKENEECLGYICSFRDRTEEHLQKLALKASEEQYRIMVEEVVDYAIFLLDRTGHVMTWNQGARHIKGYQPAEIIGKHFSKFYTLGDLEKGKPARELEIAIATGKYQEEGWRVKKNGSLFWANVVITALFNSNNEHIGFSKVTRDLTDRRSNEESMRLNEERYRSLVEQVRDYGIFLLDEKGRISSWNEGARRINGYTSEEIVGKYFSIFYPEEDILDGKPARELQIAKADGKYEEEGWRLRKDGSRFWSHVVITAVYNSEGVHTGYSKVTRDLTERKELEKEIRDSSEKYRLLSVELQRRNDELSDANRELEQFSSVASHDLQEPLRAMASFLELIRERLAEKKTADVERYLEKAQKAAQRMRNLILNLLQYTQLSKLEIAKEDVDVEEVINDVLQNVKETIDAKHAYIKVDNLVDHIEADRVQLTQLIQNLVSNALKFTEENQSRISIASCLKDQQAIFMISDNGIGIANDQVSRVFEIFRRLHAQKKYEGAGIGLAICKKIVERHNGNIFIESEVGKGTKVTFSLPVA